MTSGLRKIHLYIWLALIIIIPVMIGFSMNSLAIFSSEAHTDNRQLEIPKEGVLKTSENDLIKVLVYKSSVTIILKSTLKNSSSVVYTMDAHEQKAAVIGQLTSSGIYNFTTERPPKGIIIYDALKNAEITKLTF